ncbi:MFS transporter [Haloferula sp.]|uniref:MFS transporter n=1 Tax=Haloferula sp. TaxID=2497595 RepID=UPI00329EA727
MASSNRLFNKGFLSLTFAQFFGAVNDNILKGVLSFAVASGGLWAGQLGKGGQGYVGLCLTIPFILFSGFAGQFADRTSKRHITVIVKIAEIFITLVAFAGFFLGNLWITLLAMLLLAVQSSFFGPAKYGMIPELVDSKQLSQANGSINMFTNLAVIAGTLAAGPIYTLYSPEPGSDSSALLWVPGAALVMTAILGLLVALPIPKLSAMDPDLKINWNPFSVYWSALKEMANSHLLLVATAWASFYMIGMLAILILPDYRDLLQVSPTKASVLLGILGISIGVGSVSAGLISGKHIEPRLIPLGAVGMTLFFTLLGLTPLKFGLVAALLAGAGIFAGFYIVPLQALLQHLSPDDERGRFLGTANALSFVASSIGSLVFLLARSRFQMDSNHVFLICAGLAFIGSGFLIWRLKPVITDSSLRGK